jgi:hypothetical protein
MASTAFDWLHGGNGRTYFEECAKNGEDDDGKDGDHDTVVLCELAVKEGPSGKLRTSSMRSRLIQQAS